jgi:hypothetical protein
MIIASGRVAMEGAVECLLSVPMRRNVSACCLQLVDGGLTTGEALTAAGAMRG